MILPNGTCMQTRDKGVHEFGAPSVCLTQACNKKSGLAKLEALHIGRFF